MTDPFKDPASGFVKIGDFNGKVLIVKPIQMVTGLTTKHSKTPGDTSAVDVDVTVLNEDGTYEEHAAMRVFQRGLISQFSRAVGSMVIGRLGMEPTPKGDAWVLQKATDADRALGMKYLEAKNNAALQTPAPAMAGATARGVDPLA